jgi:hypothetical protein
VPESEDDRFSDPRGRFESCYIFRSEDTSGDQEIIISQLPNPSQSRSLVFEKPKEGWAEFYRKRYCTGTDAQLARQAVPAVRLGCVRTFHFRQGQRKCFRFQANVQQRAW